MPSHNPRSRIGICLTAVLLSALAASSTFGQPRADHWDGRVQGTWYLALDAEPFGLPPGTNLPGLAQFHTDHTMTLLDAGDLAAVPFPTRDTTQMGNWSTRRGQVLTMTLFLQVDGATNQALGWNMVQLQLGRPHGNVMEGVVNVSFLACDPNTPFAVFFCPSPVEFLHEFEPLPPADIPVSLTRLPSP
jgi:hypothetical protein